MNSNNLKDLYEGYSAVYDDNLRESLKFETWVNELLDEGYDLSDYTLDELYDVYEERGDGVKEYIPNPTQAEISQSSNRRRTIPSRHNTGYGPDEKFTKPDDMIANPGTTVPAPKKGGYGRISPAIPHGIGDHANKTQSRVSTIVRKDPGAPNSQKLPPEERKRLSREIVRKNLNNSYEPDLFDVILEYLITEGYAETVEAAEVIMVNMSEDWRESICEANRGDEYATRGMSPEDANTWKSERRNKTRGFSSDVEEKRKNAERYKEKYGKYPRPNNDMGGSQWRRQADTRDARGQKTALTFPTSDTLSPSGIKGTVTKPVIRIGTPLGGTQNPEPTGKYLHRHRMIDAQSSDPTKRFRAPQNSLYHMN